MWSVDGDDIDYEPKDGFAPKSGLLKATSVLLDR
jgi:hypothetical protein